MAGEKQLSQLGVSGYRMLAILTRGGWWRLWRVVWNRIRKPLFGCLVGAGIVLAWDYGVFLVTRWQIGVVFPGMQFSYSSNSTKPKVFRLTLYGTYKVARVRLAPDYVDALFPGARGGYAIVDITAYLPDMAPEQVYDARDKQAAELYPDEPPEQKLKELQISLEADDSEPTDPSTKLGFVTDSATNIPKENQRLKHNPHPAFYGYIWGPNGDTAIDGGGDTWTDYFPKNNNQFYVHCSGEGGPDADCSILFVYKKLIDVDIGIEPQNIDQSATIVQKVSAFLDGIIDLRK